ncbi:hypothetical protein F4777DRAFT_563850 [Nemania sp. FL0916]|nr:hypothetical protein F4777DRAFT_563850 [Nemania sp. FL0916]
MKKREERLQISETPTKTTSALPGHLYACHSGAATEALCYVNGTEDVTGPDYEFYYNYTYDGAMDYPGAISNIMSIKDQDGNQEQMPVFWRIIMNWASNAHTILLPPGPVDVATMFSINNYTRELYIGGTRDDRHWNDTKPSEGRPHNLSMFHLCYQWAGDYWYHSLAWVTGVKGTKPQNPSCTPVTISIAAPADGKGK